MSKPLYVLNAIDHLQKISDTLTTIPVPIIRRNIAAVIQQLKEGAAAVSGRAEKAETP